jgi:hypothetical protein
MVGKNPGKRRGAVMSRAATLAVFFVIAGCLSGCRIHEYVVARDEVPLYDTPRCEKVVDRMPLGHHERISESDDEGGVLRVVYNGRTGYARSTDLKLLAYMHPELDEGVDREEKVGRAVRDVTVGAAGKDWTDDMKSAIRDGRVVDGMTREQVELSWGWPRTIEPLANPTGGERWIYRRRGFECLDSSMGPTHRFRPARYAQPGPWGLESAGAYYRLPVVEERVVEFQNDKVGRSYVRRYYDVEGTTDDDS